MPEYAISKNYPTDLENNFTVCYWEQRGTGLSYVGKDKESEITFEQLIADTLEVTDYLSQRFGQEKIYLMAHSGGTFIGIQAAARSPEKYHSYIAIAQITKQLESEKLAYSYMLNQFEKMGDQKMLKRLLAIPLSELETMPASYRGLRDEAMHKLGIGTTREMKSVVKGIFLPVMLSSEYEFSEKVNIWRGKWSKNSRNLWNQILATDITQEVTELAIPVYFFEGLYDYTCSYKLAKEYFEQLKAPIKEFYTFEQSAHSPLFEEPDKMQQILLADIIKGEKNETTIKSSTKGL
jgi:pimeloyl-ACP methyl ester carboxylesterase